MTVQRLVDAGLRERRAIEPERNPGGSLLTHDPGPRYARARDAQRHAYGAGPFCRFRVPRDWREPGVYALVVDGEVRYIGKTVDLSEKVQHGPREHLTPELFQGRAAHQLPCEQARARRGARRSQRGPLVRADR